MDRLEFNLLLSGSCMMTMKVQPGLLVKCDTSPFACCLMSSSSPSCSSSFPPPPFLAPFLPFPLPCTPPPSVFPMDCLPIDSYCICTSLIIFLPLPPYGPLYITLSLTHFHFFVLLNTYLNIKYANTMLAYSPFPLYPNS